MTTLTRKVRSEEKKGEKVDDLKKELKEAEKLAAKYKKEMGDMQVSSRTLVGYTALPASIDLQGRIVILNAQDRDLEMIEYGLDCLSLSPVLGAQSARGCGEISGTFDIQTDGVITKKITIGGYSPSQIDVF